MMSDGFCEICGNKTLLWFQVSDVPPLQNQLFSSKEEACASSTTEAAFWRCQGCGCISIDKNISLSFDQSYNNSDIASPIMQAHYLHIARQIRRFLPDPLTKTKIIEIGCGRGELLSVLETFGYQNIFGYDPAAPKKLDHIKQEYWHKLSENDIADCFILRHTLEEITKPGEFVRDIAESLSSRGLLYVEITNATTLNDPEGIFSLYPECQNLFTLDSIVFLATGNNMLVQEVEYFDQGRRVGIWMARYNVDKERPKKWCDIVRKRFLDLPKPIALWGAAGRGSNILSFLKLDREIECVIDIDERKHGLFLPPYGHKVVPPESAHDHSIKTILVANEKYFSEISSQAPAGASIVTINSLIGEQI